MLERPVRVGKTFRLFFDKARSLKRKYKRSCVLRRAIAAPPRGEKKGSVFREGVWIVLFYRLPPAVVFRFWEQLVGGERDIEVKHERA